MKKIYVLGLSNSILLPKIIKYFFMIFNIKIFTFSSPYCKKDFQTENNYKIGIYGNKFVELASFSCDYVERNLTFKGALRTFEIYNYSMQYYELSKDIYLYNKLDTNNSVIILDKKLFNILDVKTKESIKTKIYFLPLFITYFVSFWEVVFRLILVLLKSFRKNINVVKTDLLIDFGWGLDKDKRKNDIFFIDKNSDNLKFLVCSDVKKGFNKIFHLEKNIFGFSLSIKNLVFIFKHFSKVLKYPFIIGESFKFHSIMSQVDFKIYKTKSYVNALEKYILNYYDKKLLFIEASCIPIHKNPIIRYSDVDIHFSWSRMSLESLFKKPKYFFDYGNPFKIEYCKFSKTCQQVLIFDTNVSNDLPYTEEFYLDFLYIVDKLVNKNKNVNFIFKSKEKKLQIIKDSKFEQLNAKLIQCTNFKVDDSDDISTLIEESCLSISMGLNSAGIITSSNGIPSFFYFPKDYYNKSFSFNRFFYKESSKLISDIEDFIQNNLKMQIEDIKYFQKYNNIYYSFSNMYKEINHIKGL